MAGKAAQSVVKAIGGYQYPWKERLAKYKDELSKGVWGYWELGAWKDLGISARRRARLRKEVLLAGQDWPYDPARKEMRSKRKGHKCDRISAEKRANTAELMKKMPEMLLDYKKRRWEKKMKEEDAKNLKRKEPKIASSNAVVESDSPEEIEEDPSKSDYLMERELGTSTGDDEECCCVCLSRLTEGDQTRRLPCFHMFHKMCVGRWLDLCGKTCPLCRFSVEGESSQRKEEELTEEMVIWFSSFHAAGF